MTTVTIDEGKVIASLLELYDAAWHDGNHAKGCECRFCIALEKSGEFDFRLFDSLKARFASSFNRCPECGNLCDDEVCWCGDEKCHHHMGSGHNFVPMGCTCGYATSPSPGCQTNAGLSVADSVQRGIGGVTAGETANSQAPKRP